MVELKKDTVDLIRAVHRDNMGSAVQQLATNYSLLADNFRAFGREDLAEECTAKSKQCTQALVLSENLKQKSGKKS